MSRLGKKPSIIPAGVTVVFDRGVATVKGPKGSLELTCPLDVNVRIEGQELAVDLVRQTNQARANWGTTVRHLQNMMTGVTTGFQKQLELNGVGFRMALAGKKLNMALGFSHPVVIDLPEGIDAKIENNILTISGIDKQRVGQFAAEIRELKPVEPYKGKGFKYVGEVVRRKEGKKAAA